MSSPSFQRAWYATDLGLYRPCRVTYEIYPYESLPRIPAGRLTGTFEWLGDTNEPDAEAIAEMERISHDLAAMGLSLPPDYVRFRANGAANLVLDEVSVTGSWSDVAGPTPSPIEPDAALVRIFSDQQYCASWYLYLRPTGESFVVFDVDGGSTDPAAEESILLNQEFRWCAESFEEFAYRYWIENRLWQALRDPDTGMAPELGEYLAHYQM